MSEIDAALLIVRVWAGVVLVAHGVNHGRSLEGTARWFASKGFRAPAVNAYLSAAGEIAVGLALIAGLLTAVAAAGVVAIMLGAFWTVHRFAGFFVFRRPDEGYEYVLTLAAIALALAIAGPGRVSVDATLGIDQTLSGWSGVLIFAAGVALGAAQLALLWRRPAREDKTS